MFYQTFLSRQVKRLLLMNMVYTSRLTSCKTASDLGSYEISKNQESV